MKNYFFTFFMLFVSINFIDAQVPRKVLVEEFTNASCGPCANQNPTFNTVLNGAGNSVIAIKRQTVFPGYDPMNETNPTEVDASWDEYVNFYNPIFGNDGITGVPVTIINGEYPNPEWSFGSWPSAQAYNGAPGVISAAMIAFFVDQSSQLSINLNITTLSDATEATAVITIKNESTTEFNGLNQKLRVNLIEKEIKFLTAPGTNGEKDFEDVFRRSYTTGTGIEVGTLAPGETKEIVLVCPLKSEDIFYYNQLALVAYIQNSATKLIEQAEEASISFSGVTFGDITVENKTEGFFLICPDPNVELIPKATIKNSEGEADIEKVQITTFLDAVVYKIDTLTVNLAPSATVDYELPKLDLTTVSSGAISFEAHILPGSGVLELSAINNKSTEEVFGSLPAESINSFEYQAETEVDADKTILDNAVKISGNYSGLLLSPISHTSPVGGYANSASSYVTDYYNWNTNTYEANAEVALQKVSFKDKKEVKIFWDRAYSGYLEQGVSYFDGMELYYSLDCGTTWKQVYSKMGAALQTAQSQAPLFIPTSSFVWKSDTVKISELDGKEEVIFKYKFISNFGNLLWIDNINTSARSIDVNKLTTLESTKTYPNPANDFVYLDLNLNQADEISVMITDMNGKVMSTPVKNKAFLSGKYQIKCETDRLASGLYLVKIKGKTGEQNTKLNIVK